MQQTLLSSSIHCWGLAGLHTQLVVLLSWGWGWGRDLPVGCL